MPAECQRTLSQPLDKPQELGSGFRTPMSCLDHAKNYPSLTILDCKPIPTAILKVPVYRCLSLFTGVSARPSSAFLLTLPEPSLPKLELRLIGGVASGA
jgi:hypothetical protein